MKKRTIIALILVFCFVFVLAACGKKEEVVTKVTSPEDFPGHSIAVQVDTTSADSIDRMIEEGMENVEVRRYDKVIYCFDDLALGRVDAVYVDSVVAAFYTIGNDKYQLAWLDSVDEPMGLCLAKGSESLAQAIEKALDMMFFDGSMAKIAATHFGEYYTADIRNVTAEPVIPTDFTTIKPGKLMVGAEIGYPPMEYKADDGTTNVGFDVDVSYRLGELLGLDVEIVDTSWDGIFMSLEKGEYDVIISSVSITPERQQAYILTEPYIANALCIVTAAE